MKQVQKHSISLTYLLKNLILAKKHQNRGYNVRMPLSNAKIPANFLWNSKIKCRTKISLTILSIHIEVTIYKTINPLKISWTQLSKPISKNFMIPFNLNTITFNHNFFKVSLFWTSNLYII
jgi:hypothetical protein